jgi:hypothetical protein
MSLENVKVGDWIKVQVTKIKDSDLFPIKCGKDLSFNKNGNYIEGGGQIAFPTVETERWMLVSDDSIRWRKRKVITNNNNKFIVWSGAETDEEVNNSFETSYWNFAKEIETKIEFNLELSLEEIAEKFGVNVEQIKIKK